MTMIKFNGVRKVPGRPTLVEGVEGRRYVDNKILKNLESSQRVSGYNAYTTCSSASPYSYSPGQALDDFEYGVDQDGFSSEPLTHENRQQHSFSNEEDSPELEHIEPYFEEFQYSENECYVSAYDAGEISTSQNLVWTQDSPVDATIRPLTDEGFEISDLFKACVEHNAEEQRTIELNIKSRIDRADELKRIREEFSDLNLAYTEAQDFELHCDAKVQSSDYETNESGYVHRPFSEAFYSSNCARNNQATGARAMKTDILRLPQSGVVRSSRGTVELLVHANGLTFKPFYNLCGMLVSVTISDGRRIEKSFYGNWRLISSDGKALSERIDTVSFDKKGNLWYQTAQGKRVTFFVDGHTETLRQTS
ncbi:hypothetical protein KF707_07880 [Candidatus Obscuribacterales bacterium]|nr:hypothetical protein [Candidatus Obscuribacterales bacterium]